MNELKLINKNGIFYADSRQVAEMIGKQHFNLLRDIDNYISVIGQNSKLSSDNFFIKSTYKSGTGKTYPCYLITRKGCDMVANKMTGDKGILFTAEYVTRFDEMEKQLTKPKFQLPDFTNPAEAARAWANEFEAKQKAQKQVAYLTAENQMQAQIISEFKPKVEYVDVILQSTGTVTTTQIAADYGLSAKKLNKILHDEKIQHKVNNQWILYKDQMNKGYTKSETIFITRSDGREETKMYMKWTQKGRLKIHEILTNLGFIANFDYEQAKLFE